MNFFHNFPVFWMLPPGIDKASGGEAPEIPDAVFDEINRMPMNTPRIFLSHMPIDLFEFRLAPLTKVFYLIREPHGVWHSLAKWLERLFQLVYESKNSIHPGKELMTPSQCIFRHFGQKLVTHCKKLVSDALIVVLISAHRLDDPLRTLDKEQYTRDFLNGALLLPPRVRESGVFQRLQLCEQFQKICKCLFSRAIHYLNCVRHKVHSLRGNTTFAGGGTRRDYASAELEHAILWTSTVRWRIQRPQFYPLLTLVVQQVEFRKHEH